MDPINNVQDGMPYSSANLDNAIVVNKKPVSKGDAIAQQRAEKDHFTQEPSREYDLIKTSNNGSVQRSDLPPEALMSDNERLQGVMNNFGGIQG